MTPDLEEARRLAQEVLARTPPNYRTYAEKILSRAFLALYEQQRAPMSEPSSLSPTPWAYEQACKALHLQRERAERLEGKLKDAEAMLREISEWFTKFKRSPVLHDQGLPERIRAHLGGK